MNIRPDTLALLLNFANINAESRVLLVDKTRGLVVGALIEKEVTEVVHLELAHQ